MRKRKKERKQELEGGIMKDTGGREKEGNKTDKHIVI